MVHSSVERSTTVPSSPVEARISPSGSKATLRTGRECSWSRISRSAALTGPVDQGAERLGRLIDTVCLDAQQHPQVDTVEVGLARQLARASFGRAPVRFGGGPDGDGACDQREQRQRDESEPDPSPAPLGATPEIEILADDVRWFHVAETALDCGDLHLEVGVVECEAIRSLVRAVAGSRGLLGEVQVERLLCERVVQRSWRQRSTRLGPAGVLDAPFWSAFGDGEDDVIGRMRAQPVFDLLADPRGSGRIARRDDDQERRTVERVDQTLLERAPDAEAPPVEIQLDRATPGERLGQLLDPALQCVHEQAVSARVRHESGVAVGAYGLGSRAEPQLTERHRRRTTSRSSENRRGRARRRVPPIESHRCAISSTRTSLVEVDVDRLADGNSDIGLVLPHLGDRPFRDDLTRALVDREPETGRREVERGGAGGAVPGTTTVGGTLTSSGFDGGDGGVGGTGGGGWLAITSTVAGSSTARRCGPAAPTSRGWASPRCAPIPMCPSTTASR